MPFTASDIFTMD